MIEISINEAKKCLIDSSLALYGDLVYHLQDVDIVGKSSAYESHGAIIIKTTWYHSENIVWYLCDIGNSNMISALTELTKKFGKNINRAMYCLRDYPGDHCYVFERKGELYNDVAIRLLSENDRELIISLTKVADDDNEYAIDIAKMIHENIAEINNKNIYVHGIFDGTILAGLIISKKHNIIEFNLEYVNIVDLFITRNYRGRGYATRLIRYATAVFPDLNYIYSCGTINLASIASAKSAGYILGGTYIDDI